MDDSVNSASGVIARKLSDELNDLAAVAETEQDVSRVFDWSDEECLGVQIGWYCYAVDIRRCEGQSPRRIEDVRASRVVRAVS